MPRCKIIFFTFLTMLFSKEQLFWDLGVKIKESEKKELLIAKEKKHINDNTLFNEVAGLSSKLKISQKIIDQENKLINAKIEKEEQKPTLIFDSNSIEKNKNKNNLNAYQSGRYKDAIIYLDKISKSPKTKIEANKINYLKANAYFNLGEFEKAEFFLEQLISNKENKLLDDALLLKGIILKQRGKREEALVVFSEIINDHPNSDFYESAQIQKRLLSRKKDEK